MKIKAVITTAALILLAAAPAVAATILDMTVKSETGTQTDQLRMTIEDKMLRIDTELTEGEPRTSVVFRGDREELMILDHAKSEAMLIDKDSVEKMAAQMQRMQAQMEQAMANVPPAQREMMKKMMEGKMGEMVPQAPAPTEVRKTSETGTTNGYPWVKYELLQDGQKVQEFLVTDWSNLKIDASTFDVFKEMTEFFESLTQSFGADMPMDVQNPFGELSKFEGFPVVTRQFDGDALEGQIELTGVKTGDVSGDLFENPGYEVKKIEPPAGR